MEKPSSEKTELSLCLRTGLSAALGGYFFALTEISIRKEPIMSFDFIRNIDFIRLGVLYLLVVTSAFFLAAFMLCLVITYSKRWLPQEWFENRTSLVYSGLYTLILLYLFNFSGHTNYIKEYYGSPGSVTDNIIISLVILFTGFLVYLFFRFFVAGNHYSAVISGCISGAVFLSLLDPWFMDGFLGNAYSSVLPYKLIFLLIYVSTGLVILYYISRAFCCYFGCFSLFFILQLIICQHFLSRLINISAAGILFLSIIITLLYRKSFSRAFFFKALVSVVALLGFNAFIFSNGLLHLRAAFETGNLAVLPYLKCLSPFLIVVLIICISRLAGTDIFCRRTLKKEYPDASAILSVLLFLLLCCASLLTHYSYNFNPDYAGQPTGSQLPQDTPNVIIITWDTVRRDHLSVYGYPRNTSPELEEFAKNATMFERAFATTGSTFPSHASIFTGKLPFVHGVLDQKSRFFLAPENTTLAEILKKKGYITVAVSAHPSIHAVDLTQGFKYVYDAGTERSSINVHTFLFNHFTGDRKGFMGHGITGEVRAERLNLSAAQWLKKFGDKPFFMFINYFDAHDPYSPVDEYRDYYADSTLPSLYRSYDGKVKQDINLYNAEIACLDYHTGKLFNLLRELNLYDNSLIVVESDHGEGFGEHGWYFHGPCLYREVSQVPLVIKYPGQIEGIRCNKPAGIEDIFPTVLEALGYRVPDDIQAVSLVEPDRLSEQGAKIIEGYYLNSEARMEVRRSLIRYPFELMVEQDGVKKLYDLEQDPLELADLSRAEPEIVERMADELKRTIEALEPLKITPKVGARRMSKELEKQLKALGYIK